MKKIKEDTPLWVLKTKAFTLGLLSEVLPLRAIRRAYLRAFYVVWETESSDREVATYNPDDVYNGHSFEWSRRPLPPAVADRLLELHDAQVENERGPEWKFEDLLKQNLHLH